MTAFPADIPDEAEEPNGWYDAISAGLLGISVVIWTLFWGAVWLSSLVYVALHLHNEHFGQARLGFRRWRGA